MATVYAEAAQSLAEDVPRIVKAYKAGLRDLRSPLALRPEAWATCRHQAESIVADCIAALDGGVPSHHIEIKRYSRTVGFDRVAQGIGVAESIRAVEVLWAAMQASVRAAAARERESDRASVLLAITTAFRSSAMSRLYAGAVGYDAALAQAAAASSAEDAPAAVVGSRLTRREKDVLAGVENALSNAQIASQLGISSATVKRHLQNIYGKLGAVSRVDAVNKGRRQRPS